MDPQLLTGTDIRGDALSGLAQAAVLDGQLYPGDPAEPARQRLGEPRSAGSIIPDRQCDPGPRPHRAVGRQQRGLLRGSRTTTSSSTGMGPDSRSRVWPSGCPSGYGRAREGRRCAMPTFNLVPSNVRWSSGLTKDQADYSLFSVPVARPEDEFIQPNALSDPSLAQHRRADLAAARHALAQLRHHQHPRPPGLSRLDLPRPAGLCRARSSSWEYRSGWSETGR